MAMISTAFPTAKSAVGKAVMLIIASGPRSQQQLFTEVDFGAHGTQKSKIHQAIQADWLRETPAGLIDVTESMRKHFTTPAPKEKYVDEKAAPRYHGDWRAGSLSRQHIPNSRGLRQDVPDWSRRPEGFVIKCFGGDKS